MPSALSADLLERVVTAIEAGALRREVARRFEVSPASAVLWHETFVREGRTQAKSMASDQRSHAVEAQADLTRQTYEAQPGLFLHELGDRLAERGLRVGVSSLSRFFKCHGITKKKTAHAAEQDREDVKAARLSWFERQLDPGPDRLVFLDETATNTKMARRYGRAPRGERCRVAVSSGGVVTTDRALDILPLTVPKIRHLLAALVGLPPADTAAILRWSVWRRRHQQHARRAHWLRRTQRWGQTQNDSGYDRGQIGGKVTSYP